MTRTTTSPNDPTTRKVRTLDRRPKRDRLIAAALEEIHQQGYDGTSLAKIAEAADVPIGNVYYYFKTKDDLLRAVLEVHVDSVEQMLAAAEAHEEPKQRIFAFIDGLRGSAAEITANGCPLGCLTQDLGRSEGGTPPDSVFSTQLAWLERQFASAGRDDARALAVHVMARTQGASTMCHTLGESEVFHAELDRLWSFVDEEL